jgi:hypothetical protein
MRGCVHKQLTPLGAAGAVVSEQSVVRVVASEQQRRLAGVGRKRRGDSTRDSAEAVFVKLLNPNAPVRLHHGDIQCHDISKSMQWSQLYLARALHTAGTIGGHSSMVVAGLTGAL